jgi:hypothetical protein
MDYTSKITFIALGYIAVTIVDAFIVKIILQNYERDIGASGLSHAGMVIGIIERVLVLSLVLVSQYTAITIVFAAKSIARFNDLKDRKTAEYYLIGTLVSITLATITGIIIRMVLKG